MKTNKVPRTLMYHHELPQDLQDDTSEEGSFFKYKGNYYDVEDFMRTEDPYWDGVLAMNAWGGIFIRLVGQDHVIVGEHYS